MCIQQRFSSESSLGAFWIASDAKFLHADYEASDQTVQMRRLCFSDVTIHFMFLTSEILVLYGP